MTGYYPERECVICMGTKGHHAKGCPNENRANHAEYRRGWEADRSRQSLPEGASDAFRLGWSHGDRAADEAENGFNPMHEGRQW